MALMSIDTPRRIDLTIVPKGCPLKALQSAENRRSKLICGAAALLQKVWVEKQCKAKLNT
jgi:hypothetical protein